VRIAFVNQPVDRVRPPIQSSLGIWTYEVGRRLARDHEVTVYTRQSNWRVRRDFGDGMVYARAPRMYDQHARALLAPLLRDRGPGRPGFASGFADAGYATSVAIDLRRRGADVIHVLNLSQFMPILRRFNPDATLVLHMQCEWLHQLDPALLRPRLACCDAIVGCSDYIAGEARRAHPELAGRCHTVFNGCDIERFSGRVEVDAESGADGDRRILFVGRVSPEKGVHVLVDAFVQVAEQDPEVELDLVGDISSLPRELIVDLSRDPVINALARFYGDRSYRTQLEERVPEALRSRVHFPGILPQSDLAALYQRAAAFVLPSSCHEAFGMPLAEAMACGRPVIGARAGGIPELFEDGISGILVEREDPEALAAALRRLLGDADLRRSMGERGRERSRRLFSWDVIARETRALYERVSRGRRR
jgi:glycosyltransferase involved in cell wall biosynthesis